MLDEGKQNHCRWEKEEKLIGAQYAHQMPRDSRGHVTDALTSYYVIIFYDAKTAFFASASGMIELLLTVGDTLQINLMMMLVSTHS